MKSFDLLLLTSHGEAFGRVVLESVYLETPVIVVKPSGATEIINNKVGRAVLSDADQIARETLEMLTQKQDTFDNEAILKKFNPMQLIQNEVQFYKKVLNQ